MTYNLSACVFICNIFKYDYGKLRGHNIVCVGGEWLYEDTMTASAGNERSCGYCGKQNTGEGYDGCIGTIPGAMNACCGHGENGDAYIQYFDKSDIRGVEALNEIAKQHKSQNIEFNREYLDSRGAFLLCEGDVK